MRLFLLCLLFVCMGCSRTLNQSRAEVGLVARSFPSTAISEAAGSKHSHSKLQAVAVPSTSGAVVPGSNPSYFVMRSADRMLSEVAAVEFRRLLLESGKFRVFSRETAQSDLVVKLSCSELVPDISQRGDGSSVPMREAGTLLIAIGSLSSSSVSYLPGVGALIHAFEPLTGITLNKKTRSRVGSVKIEMQVLTPKGQVLSAKTFAASFAVKTAERGRITSTSRYKAVAASFAQDAVLAAVKDAVAQFETLAGI